MTELIADNNPNNAWGKHVVEVVLKQWKYHRTFVVRVGGNCHGLTVLESAIDNIYDGLWDEQDDPAEITLTSDTGEQLLCTDDDDLGDEWIKNMVVSCRIIDYEPPTVNQVRALNGADPLPDGDKPYIALGSVSQ